MGLLPPKTGERRGSHIADFGFPDTGRRGSVQQQIEVEHNTLHPSDDVVRRASVTNPDFGALQADSKDASSYETDMTTRQALKLYKKAIGWSVLLSTAVIMEGFDLTLVSSLYAHPSFLEKFGNQIGPDGLPTISASWRSALNNGALIGEIIGLMATGILQDRYGYKKTIGGALTCMVGFIFIVFFSQSLGMLLAGEMLCGLCWGVFQTITTAYASEVTPVKIRAYLTTYVNLCWVIGQLVGFGVLRGIVDRTDQWAYRIPFAVQWVWPIPILIGCILAPESPWWLVRHGRFDEAKQSLLRLTTRGVDANFDVHKTVAMMEHTNQLEQEMSSGTSYFDCFKGVNLRRTEIVCGAWICQVWCGIYFTGYCTVFFESAGLSKTSAFSLSVGQAAVGFVGTVASWFIMRAVGRRTIYVWGSAAMTVLMLLIGFTGLAPRNAGASWAAGGLLLVFVFVYDFTVGPVCYSLVAELSSTRLKAKTIVLARNAYNICGIVANVLINYQLTSTAWNWGVFCGFFWSGTCFLCTVWVYFRLPEPKDRTYGELDILFDHKVSARKFATTNVNIFRGDTLNVAPATGNLSPVDEKRAVADVHEVEVVDKY